MLMIKMKNLPMLGWVCGIISLRMIILIACAILSCAGRFAAFTSGHR